MNSREVFHAKNKKGFTLIELLLVAALMISLGAFMFPLGLSFYRAQMLNETSEGLLSALRKAQSFAIAGRGEHAFGVKILPDAYVLFEGDSYDARVQNQDEIYPVASTISITGFDEVVFDELEGIPDTTGTLTITLDKSDEYIEVTQSGAITR